MKKIGLYIMCLTFLVGCGSKSETQKVTCAIANEEVSTVFTYEVKKDKIEQVYLEATIKKDKLDGKTKEEIEKELTNLMKDIEVTNVGVDTVSFRTRVSETSMEVFEKFNIKYDSKLTLTNDFLEITKFYEDNGGTCDTSDLNLID